jgi:hypothetical protein
LSDPAVNPAGASGATGVAEVDGQVGRRRFALTSVVIVVVLSLQALVGFSYTGVQAWPFMAYPMYRGAHYADERLRHDFTVYAELDDASEVVLTPEDLGLSWWTFRENVVHALYRDDRAVVQGLIDDHCRRTGQRIVGLRMEDLGYAVSRDGLVEGLPPEVIATMPVRCENQRGGSGT